MRNNMENNNKELIQKFLNYLRNMGFRKPN